MALTEKQSRFCEEFLLDLNATQAAIRAGYSERSARNEGARLLTNDDILARVQELKAERSKRTEISADFVISGIQEVAMRCLQKRPVMEWDSVERKMVQKTDDEDRNVWQFDAHGANKAFELLGKHLGVFEKDNAQKKPNSVVVFPDNLDT